MSDLITTDQIKPEQVFAPKGAEIVLKVIRQRIDEFVPEVTTAAGRKEIASFAHKVAQCKTLLDGVGKDLVSEAKQKVKEVDAERKKIRDTLDEWKADVRKPLTEWEEREANRKAALEAKVTAIDALWQFPANAQIPSETLEENLGKAQSLVINEELYEDFYRPATDAKQRTIMTLEQMLADAKKREAEQAELERLRKEAAERAKRDEEERLRKEGEERARREAEAKAEQERKDREAEQRRQQEALERAEREKAEAEQRTKDAEEKAKREAAEAAERRARQEQEAREKRERDQALRSRIKAEIVKSLDEHCVLMPDTADEVADAIMAGKIQHVTANF